MTEILEEGTFDLADFTAELTAAREGNRQIGTKVLFENERLRVWEIRLQPGERGAFHLHDRNYFWTVIEGGLGKQRLDDGTFAIRRYEVGDTSFLPNSAANPMIHDLENIGEGELRYITVELLD